MTVGLAASVVPDLDLLYFYSVDRTDHHHAFLTHWPITWLVLAGIGLFIAAVRRSRAWAFGATFFGTGGLLHLVLDSIAGEVRWFAPASEWSLTLVAVPPRFESWVLSLVTHWTFCIEVALVILAGAVWRFRRAAGQSGV